MSHGAELSVIVPVLGPLLTDGNDGTLKVVVCKWPQGGAPREEVEAQYGPISAWNAPQVTFSDLGLTDQQDATLLVGIMSVIHSHLPTVYTHPDARRVRCDSATVLQVLGS